MFILFLGQMETVTCIFKGKASLIVCYKQLSNKTRQWYAMSVFQAKFHVDLHCSLYIKYFFLNSSYNIVSFLKNNNKTERQNKGKIVQD